MEHILSSDSVEPSRVTTMLLSKGSLTLSAAGPVMDYYMADASHVPWWLTNGCVVPIAAARQMLEAAPQQVPLVGP